MPRKAMREMGFQVCCLLCDAPDIAGSERCRSCIDKHARVREGLDQMPEESRIRQLATEIVQMVAHPHRWDHDEVHGAHLKRYISLASSKAEPTPLPTAEEVGDLFKLQSEKRDGSLIRDFANRNPWKDTPPAPEVAKAISDELPEGDSSQAGTRTIPSKPIDMVDRSDRLGEDRELSDRVAAERLAARVPKKVRKEVVADEVLRRSESRAAFETIVSEVGGLLSDEDEGDELDETGGGDNGEDDLDI